jgi:hypothetical protein
MGTEEIRLTAIYWAQIAIGAIYLLTAALIPFLTDQPMLERLVWAAVLGLLPGLCMIAACVRTRKGRLMCGYPLVGQKYLGSHEN